MKNIIKDASGDKKEALRVDGVGYKTLLDNLPQKIFCKGRNSVYVFCNKNYAQDLGIRAEEIVGKTDYDFYPEELAEKYRADDERIMAAGKTEDLEEKYIRKGEEMTVHTVKTPVRNAQGSVIGILGIFWDVTEQKKMEEVTKESTERFGLLFEISIDAIFIADAKTRMLVDCNKNAEKLVGRSRAEILSMRADDIHPSDKVKETMEAFRKLTEAKIKYIETEILTKSGERIPVEISGSPFVFKGKPYLLGIFRDITERKQAEEKIKVFSDAVAIAFDYFLLTDIKGNITYANESAIKAFGYTPEEFLGLNTAKLDADPETGKKVIQDLVMKGKWSGEVMNIRKNKEKFPSILSAFVIKDEEGNPKGMMGILRDITERKQAEEELKEKNIELEQMNKLMVGRELRMAELKKEIKEPKKKSGEAGR